MPMPAAGAMLGAVPMATPQPAGHYASSFPPPAPAYVTPPPPVAGTSGAVTMPPPRASGMSPALLFVALGLSLAVLAVLVVVRFRKHDDFAIAIPTASSAAAAPSATESLEPAVDMEVDMTDAETAAIAAASGTTATSAGSNPGAGARVRRTTRSPETRRAPSTRETTPPPSPPATTAGGKGLLTVVCVPACDEVVDGRASLGPSPIFKRPSSLGPHRIVLRIHDPPIEKVVDVVVGADDVTVIRQPMAR